MGRCLKKLFWWKRHRVGSQETWVQVPTLWDQEQVFVTLWASLSFYFLHFSEVCASNMVPAHVGVQHLSILPFPPECG